MGMYGLMQKDDKYWKTLTAEDVSDIQTKGGSILGVDKVDFDADKILDNLNARGVTQLYVVGGQGTHQGLFTLKNRALVRGLHI